MPDWTVRDIQTAETLEPSVGPADPLAVDWAHNAHLDDTPRRRWVTGCELDLGSSSAGGMAAKRPFLKIHHDKTRAVAPHGRPPRREGSRPQSCPTGV